MDDRDDHRPASFDPWDDDAHWQQDDDEDLPGWAVAVIWLAAIAALVLAVMVGAGWR